MSSTETTAAESSGSVNLTPSSSSSSSLRATKRKLEDAIHSLDDAVGSSETLARPSPAKKPHTTRTIYSTLAKYGIKQKEPKESTDQSASLTRNAPHLAAILARTATRTRKALPFKMPGHAQSSSPLTPSSSEYRPSSTTSFLTRLSTFKLSTYANKPPAIDAVAASKCGWINDGKDRLVCGICNVSWVVASKEGMNRDAANALIEKQRISLVDSHKDGCPWKTRQCDASIYRIPLQSPAAMARDIKSNAVALDAVLQGVDVKHPLTSNQVQLLRSTILSVSLPAPSLPESEPPHTPTDESSSPLSVLAHEPSETAILTSLFGWALAPPPPERPRHPSLSRSSSVLHSVPSTPSLRRSPSVTSPRITNGNDTPVPSTPRPSLRFASPFVNSDITKRDASLLHCSLCQRRVGLWAFAPPPPPVPDSSVTVNGSPRLSPPQRQFDLLKEHRSYCPYVVRSTVVPSLPVPPTHGRSNSSLSLSSTNGAVEGWRAVLMVVLRYGMNQRQRMSALKNARRGSADDGGSADVDDMDVDGVEAMVTDVKSSGGKELLKYVKGLLG